MNSIIKGLKRQMLNAVKFNWLTIVIITLLISSSVVTAQSIMGYNGLFRIPTASKNTDKEVIFGLNFVDKSIAVVGESNNIRTYVSLNYLPFLEINLVLHNLINSDLPQQAIGDRQSSFKFLFADLGKIPNLAFGIYDALGSIEKGGVHSDFVYAVMSKNFSLSVFLEAEITLGYATTIYHNENTGLKGIFSGLNFKLFRSLEIFGEYDSHLYNAGGRLHLFDHLVLFGGFTQLKYPCGGISYSFVL